MIFKKDYASLVKKALNHLVSRTEITNTSVGGITRSIIEAISLNLSEYYDILDVNTTMGFVSTAEGYFLDLMGDLLNVSRLEATSAYSGSSDNTQKFYVTVGTLHDLLPDDMIPMGTIVSTPDDTIRYRVNENAPFGIADTFVYVSVSAETAGAIYNVGVDSLVKHSLSPVTLYTTNERIIVGGSDLESDDNYRYRIINATLGAEKANATAVRLAALSTPGVADVLIRPYARGIGTYDVIVIPVEGIATDKIISDVQSSINSVQAVGIVGTALKPSIVTVNIEVRLVFTSNASSADQENIKGSVKAAIEKYIVNIPIGGSFILNEMRQQIMDVSVKIKDHIINCYYFRGQPVFIGNVDIYWDEMFYPDQSLAEAIRVL